MVDTGDQRSVLIVQVASASRAANCRVAVNGGGTLDTHRGGGVSSCGGGSGNTETSRHEDQGEQ